MTETEGVIKYKPNHINAALKSNFSISEINKWRTLLFKKQLIGQINTRYEGYGFGNISQRVGPANSGSIQFIISGTQTGATEVLSRDHYCHVINADPIKNCIRSIGKTKPSSEALTHACVYQQDKRIQAVIHVHSPEIWNNTLRLKLPYTAADIAYGTPEMATEVERLMQTEQLQNERIFSMLGHTDGVIAFAETMEDAVLLLLKYHSKAILVEQSKQYS